MSTQEKPTKFVGSGKRGRPEQSLVIPPECAEEILNALLGKRRADGSEAGEAGGAVVRIRKKLGPPADS